MVRFLQSCFTLIFLGEYQEFIWHDYSSLKNQLSSPDSTKFVERFDYLYETKRYSKPIKCSYHSEKKIHEGLLITYFFNSFRLSLCVR